MRPAARRKSGSRGALYRPRPRSSRRRAPELHLPLDFLPWWGYPLAIAAFLGIIMVALLHGRIADALSAASDDAYDFFGLGIFLVLAVLLALVLLFDRGLLRSLLKRPRWLLGAGALFLAFHGLAAFFNAPGAFGEQLGETGAGGRLGEYVIGGKSFLGGVRLVIVLLISFSLLAPEQALGIAAGLGEALLSLRHPMRHLGRDVARACADILRPPAEEEVPTPTLPPAEPSTLRAETQAIPIVAGGARVEQEVSEGEEAEPQQMPMPEPSPGSAGSPAARWVLPPLELLDEQGPSDGSQVDNNERAQLIERALASYGVDAKVVQINPGPTVTQFGIEPGWDVDFRDVRERDRHGRPIIEADGTPRVRREEVGRTRVKVNRITALADDLALALAAPSIRIEAPVPGKPVVGIEVPNSTAGVVTLRSCIQTPPFQRLQARTKLAIALGKGVAGEVVVADLAKMPHLLIAGATGSGKSVCINSVIACLLSHCTPDEVRFLMIDPKRVELVGFNSVPHLLSPVIVDTDRVVGALSWVMHEMDRRYQRFAAYAVRNIEAYNKSPRVRERMPYWLVIVDELADLMMTAPYEVERSICRLAQLARATGIHLVIATQRPSVDVITGLIKANFPTRISFAVTSQVDSRTILDAVGAEKLLGRGDMLYMPTDAAKPKRLQGAYIADSEIERMVAFWADERFAAVRPAQFNQEITAAEALIEQAHNGVEGALLEQARQLAMQHGSISTSMLQRRLRIGYGRAARLVDALEEEGLVGPAESGRSRPVISDYSRRERQGQEGEDVEEPD